MHSVKMTASEIEAHLLRDFPQGEIGEGKAFRIEAVGVHSARVRLKADGRLVEIMPDGTERAIVYTDTEPKAPRLGADTLAVNARFLDAAYAQGVVDDYDARAAWEQK